MSVEVKAIGWDYAVVLTLDSIEAEGIADALGPEDGAYRELYDAARECRERNAEVER